MSIAVFDDRIEIRSFGHLPSGISPESLTGPHQSVLRNPLIAQTFHRTGAVETWGRGTNRVIEICREYGVELPVFELQGNSFLVTFRATMVPTPIQRPQVTPQVLALLTAATGGLSRLQLQQKIGLSDRTHFRMAYLEPLLAAGWLQLTIPDKPRSSRQRYRTTDLGKQIRSQHIDN
jgi:ATP-dependent DNA helicase RecG